MYGTGHLGARTGHRFAISKSRPICRVTYKSTHKENFELQLFFIFFHNRRTLWWRRPVQLLLAQAFIELAYHVDVDVDVVHNAHLYACMCVCVCVAYLLAFLEIC